MEQKRKRNGQQYENSITPKNIGVYIMKVYLYYFDPHKPLFRIVKLGFTGVYIIFFSFLLKNIDCGYSLQPHRRGGSNEYPWSMFWAEIWKMSEFLYENFHLLVVKFSVYWIGMFSYWKA